MRTYVVTSSIVTVGAMASGVWAQDTAPPFKVYLACGGTARSMQMEESSAAFRARDDVTRGVDGSISTMRQVSYESRVRVRIDGNEGTINVPRQMMPPLRGKMDENGAFRLNQISVNDRTISGQFTFNFMNKPKFTIDRTTGQMEMSGFGNGFSGVCEPIADEPAARKF